MLRSAGSVTINITGAGGNLAYGSFYSSVDQTATANTAVAMATESTADTSGVSIGDNGSGKKTRITFANVGTYNIQFSAQFYYSGGGGQGQTVTIWFALNGSKIADSATKLIVPSNAPFVVASWNFIESVTAGQYMEIYWLTDNSNIRLEHIDATATVPAVPSVIITAQQIR
jgi:hypothetical protein